MRGRLTSGSAIAEKTREATSAILPILVIVIILSLTAAPMPTSIMLSFLFGALMLTIGMIFFSLGAEMSMTTIGELVGSSITKSRRLPVIIAVSFLIGFIVTVAEPDLQVLAGQVPSVPNMALILSVAVGVGLFLVMAMVRMLFNIPLPPLLVGFYAVVFILSAFVPKSFLAVAFDSGGVTTGPMTVPFIMALGVGVSSIRSDKHAADDSFGLVALSSIGPILAVMSLGMIYRPASGDYAPPDIPDIADSVELGQMFGSELPTYMWEIFLSLLPIAVFFFVFQVLVIRLTMGNLLRVIVGLVYTYAGLVVFLTGVNVGFMPAGNYLGRVLAGSHAPWIIVPVAMAMGFFVVRAEPAVYVLKNQVEEITDGGIRSSAIGISLSVGVAVSLGISMLRVLLGIPIMWFIVPGYLIALGISFFVPKIYTAIAFDSGGVASGPVTAAFLLPLAQGASVAVGGDIVSDAFGVVAMVAMTPLIAIQVLGILSKIAEKRSANVKKRPQAENVPERDAIIEL